MLGKNTKKHHKELLIWGAKKNTFNGFDKYHDQNAKICTVVLALDEEGDPNFRAKGVDTNSWPRIRNKLVLIPPSSEH